MYKEQPYSIEAEKSVLGCMLIDKTSLNEVLKNLTTEDFYNPLHQEIFNACVDLNSKNKVVDIVTVSGKHDISYLAELTELVTTTAATKNYINIVKGKSIRREYIRAGQAIIDMAYNGEYDTVSDLKNEAISKVDIDIKETRKKDTSFKEIYIKMLNNIEEKQNSQGQSTIKWGYNWLDRWTGGVKNCLIYLAARPSIGKTTFALNLGLNIASQGLKVAMFNLEMEDTDIVEKAVSIELKMKGEKLQQPWKMDERESKLLYTDEATRLSKYSFDIFDDVFTIEEIKGCASELKAKKGLDFLIIDYLQLIDTKKKTSTENEKISHISRQMKMMQKQFRCPVLCLSQLSRVGEKEKRKPALTDLRSSGSIEQDADIVWFLHDESAGDYVEAGIKEYNEVELIMAKQRKGRRDIYTTLKFFKDVQRFCE